MANPEQLAVRLVKPMQGCMALLTPVVWLYSRGADALFRLLGLSALRDERITSDDILAMMEAGTRAGVLQARDSRSSPMCSSWTRAWCPRPCRSVTGWHFSCAMTRTP